MHLFIQLAENIFNLAATPEKAFGGFERQSISLMLADREIQRTLDCLGLSFGVQGFLSALDFYRVQLKVFVYPAIVRSHDGSFFKSSLSRDVHESSIYVHHPQIWNAEHFAACFAPHPPKEPQTALL
ncbi:MAG: hypothetical protein WCB53_16115 [Terriglobales bacterium]